MSLGSYAGFYAEKIKRELETLRKKKQHLDSLLNKEKISKPTYDYLAKDLDDEIVEMESQQKTEADTITLKLKELEHNTKKLEICLAEIELKHIASEIDVDLYEQESKILTLGIDNAKRELNNAKTALFKLFPEVEATTTEIQEDKVKETEELEAPTEETIEAVSTEEEAEEPAINETSTEDSVDAAEIEDQEATEEQEAETEHETWNGSRISTNTKWWE